MGLVALQGSGCANICELTHHNGFEQVQDRYMSDDLITGHRRYSVAAPARG